jgi:cytochrome c
MSLNPRGLAPARNSAGAFCVLFPYAAAVFSWQPAERLLDRVKDIAMHMLVVAMALLLSAGLSKAAFAADTASGEQLFNNNCRTCHSWKEGDNRLGPTLHGIVGRKSGSIEGYGNYSQSMKQANVTWDEATLDKFIAHPDSVVQNNNMKPFSGVGDQATRQKIIEFLKSK